MIRFSSGYSRTLTGALCLAVLVSASAFADLEFQGFQQPEVLFFCSTIAHALAALNPPGARLEQKVIQARKDSQGDIGSLSITARVDTQKNPLYQLLNSHPIIIRKDLLDNWFDRYQQTLKRTGEKPIPANKKEAFCRAAEAITLDDPATGASQKHVVVFNLRFYQTGFEKRSAADFTTILMRKLYGETYTRLMDPAFQGKQGTAQTAVQQQIKVLDRTLDVLGKLVEHFKKLAAPFPELGQDLESEEDCIPALKKERNALRSPHTKAGPNGQAVVRWATSPLPPADYSEQH